ncbi:P-loop containing nucleoside triphosphate hydrolase protein [Hyaloraphidium curvatum]|nr:P-loop containing nucleoside triphosphate hydrolase protein [Hyaloraphidium curvatum]
MDSTYDSLARGLRDKLDSAPPGARIVVSISGIAGSGKSTLASEVCRRVNNLLGSEVAMVVSMDGWHLPKSELDRMADPAAAHARRGAPFSFDPDALLEFVRKLGTNPGGALHAPSFDHAVGDPVPDDICVLPSHRIVLLEGLYLLLSDAPWRDIGPLVDESWLIECDLDVASERVAKRHVLTGLATSLETGRERWRRNDLLNAQIVLERSGNPTRKVPSVQQSSL